MYAQGNLMKKLPYTTFLSKLLFVFIFIGATGCSVIESLNCELSGWEPEEIDVCREENTVIIKDD